MADLPDYVSQVTLGADTVLFSAVLAVGATSPLFATAGYDSLEISNPAPQLVTGLVFVVTWFDVNSQVTVQDVISEDAYGSATLSRPLLVPVRGPFATVTNQVGAAQQLSVLGTGRPLSQAIGAGFLDYSSFTTGSIAMAAGGNYPLNPLPILSQGRHTLGAIFTGTTVVGELYLVGLDANGASTNVCVGNTTEASAVSTNRFLTRDIILPKSPSSFLFVCRAAGTCSVSARLTGLGA